MLSEVNFSVVYSSGENEPAEFFLDALCNSNRFNLALGYFSTSGFRALALGFACFISNGGSMRIIINSVLSPKDKEAFRKGINTKPNELISDDITANIEQLYTRLNSYDKHFFNCISWLIASQKIEFVAIEPIGLSIGIAHQKFGVFSDASNNVVAFNGSANFSSNALFNNMETISCYRSWVDDNSDIQRITYFQRLFEDIWSDNNNYVKRIPFERIQTYISTKFPVTSLDQLLEEEEQLLSDSHQKNLLSNRTIKNYQHKLEKLKSQIFPSQQITPHLPDYINLRDYQFEAFRKWQSANGIGLFAMATGTGKTITALNCALELFKREDQYQILILVPTLPLASQWKEELERLSFTNLILVNSKKPEWQQHIQRIVNLSHFHKTSFVLIVTYATFRLREFQSMLMKIPETTLLIADEVHNFGAKTLMNLMPERIKRRIGLSATPTRYFDETGTSEIEKYLGVDKGPTFELSIADAIEKDLLCRYLYYPRIVYLSDDELSSYAEITKKLAKFYDAKNDCFRNNPIVTALLLKRKNIINRAEGKLDLLRSIMKNILTNSPDSKYILLYCPEGSLNLSKDKSKIIDSFSRIIANEFKLTQYQFIGTTKNREGILKRFSEGKISVISSMKCLDEGIDIKRAQTAIFSASTGNPRQFIQRRGRVLRKHPDKLIAIIYDMVVVAHRSLNSFTDTDMKIEKSIIKKELERVCEFARTADNKYEALQYLDDIVKQFGIDVYSDKYL